MIEPPYFVTMEDAARIAGVTTRTIRRWVEAGRLTRYRYGVDYFELQQARDDARDANPVRRAS